MPNGLLRLLLKVGVLTLPLVVTTLLYPVLDPFKVVRRHASFYDSSPVILNRDFVSTQTFLQTFSEHRYDSFIFGNSRSLAFHCADWQRYLPPGSRPYHFDAWSETLFGILTKLRLLERLGLPIKDALLVVDDEVLGVRVNVYHHLFIKHPVASGESELGFHARFAGAYFAHAFFLKYFDWKLFGTHRGYMSDVFDKETYKHLPETNDLIFESVEQALARDEDAFYEKHKHVFTPQKPIQSPAWMEPEHQAMLAEIAGAFRRHGTRVEVIISPNYEQFRLAPADRAVVERAFGADRVCDFTGVNEWTTNVRNYYERSHYRPHVARELLKLAYGDGDGRGYCAPSRDRTVESDAARSSTQP